MEQPFIWEHDTQTGSEKKIRKNCEFEENKSLVNFYDNKNIPNLVQMRVLFEAPLLTKDDILVETLLPFP